MFNVEVWIYLIIRAGNFFYSFSFRCFFVCRGFRWVVGGVIGDGWLGWRICLEGRKQHHTSPLFVKKTTSPWLPLRCRWPSSFGMRIGVATSNELTSICWPKPLENSACWNKLKGEWWHIEALKSCSRTGTPDVATAQQGRNTSMDPLTTVRSAPFPPTTYQWWRKYYKENNTKCQLFQSIPILLKKHVGWGSTKRNISKDVAGGMYRIEPSLITENSAIFWFNLRRL